MYKSTDVILKAQRKCGKFETYLLNFIIYFCRKRKMIDLKWQLRLLKIHSRKEATREESKANNVCLVIQLSALMDVEYC